MIARMSKYDFVLYAAQSGDFIDRLRELGLVDITTTGWEPSDEDRQLLLDIEGTTKAAEFLKTFRADAARCNGQAAPFASGTEAYEHYAAAQHEAAALGAEIGRLEKSADELRPWGAFDAGRLRTLAERGVVVRCFFTQANIFDKNADEWRAQYPLEVINRADSTVWFVVVTAPGEEVSFDAQEMKTPTMDIREVERRIGEARTKLAALDAEFSRVAASEKLLAAYGASLRERLQGVRVEESAARAADGTLLVLEGWAETETSARVDALLEEYPNVIYLKSDPTPEDDTPVKLKNNRFARIFEMIGDLYARPKYGTLDLTPFFAPFYMLFFGICLNDAGYGLVLLAAGLVMLRKFREPGMMRRAAWFATLCAIATIVFGGICGSFFGLSLAQYFPSIPFFDFQGKFFIISLVIGLVQILFGMALNIWTTTRCFGIAQAFGQIGWFVILLTCVLGVALPMASITIPGFTAGSVAFYVALGIGFVLLLLLNNVKRNPLINVGAGLWDLYNNITGLLSDVLSYIRLFAIGLSGGVLALVFNTLAQGFVPEGANIFVRLLVMIPILLIGHGINLFMSTISSFVHPMRLTFVEFFKNAGFEMATRSFDPIRKMDQTGE